MLSFNTPESPARSFTLLAPSGSTRFAHSIDASRWPEYTSRASVVSQSPILQILATSVVIFACYLVIGLQLAVLPRFVHLDLGYGALIAGLVISAQYVATLSSRPLAGRTADELGAKRTVIRGLMACGASGVGLGLAALLQRFPSACMGALIVSRLLLGFGESWVATGATIWGMGRVGLAHSAQVISWSGIASYGALAAGAPLGLWLEINVGFGAIGVVSIVIIFVTLLWGLTISNVPITPGSELPMRSVLRAILPFGVCLALGGIGFGTIATFTTLYYSSRHWNDAGLALSLFGMSFVISRILFVRTIEWWGGFLVALASLVVESGGLLLLWLAETPSSALAGAALSGFGFALVFPALGVEAVRRLPAHSRGSALGVYTAFIDLSIGVSGPIAGLITGSLGYQPIFLFGFAMAAMSVMFVCMLQRGSFFARSQAAATEIGMGSGPD